MLPLQVGTNPPTRGRLSLIEAIGVAHAVAVLATERVRVAHSVAGRGRARRALVCGPRLFGYGKSS